MRREGVVGLGFDIKDRAVVDVMVRLERSFSPPSQLGESLSCERVSNPSNLAVNRTTIGVRSSAFSGCAAPLVA